MDRSAEADELRRLAERAGVFRLEIPTPFPSGSVNAYLVEADPPVLIDAGPNTATALVALEALLARHGRRLEDIALIVVTHQHIDHAGLARVASERSGAPVASVAALAPYLADWTARAAADDDFEAALMERHGMPAAVARGVREVMRMMRGMGAPVEAGLAAAPGSLIELGDRSLRVLHRPGHSPSDTVYVDEVRGIAFAGDHLLADMPSLTVPAPPLDSAVRPPSGIEYRASLAATRELDLELVLGGHGGMMGDHRALIGERLAVQERRAERLLDALRAGPRSAYAIALDVFGDGAYRRPFATVAAVLSSLDLLVDAGAAAEGERDGISVFAAP